MFKSLVISAALMVSSVATYASDSLATFIAQKQMAVVQDGIKTMGLNWNIGDTNNYKVNMGGFINGTMKMYVSSITADGIWMTQEINLMVMNQKVETLLDQASGEVKKVLVDGKEQQLPNSSTPPEIIDQRAEKVTVPAGTFDCIYVKMKQDGKESEAWVNPRDIPLSGMLKMISATQFGPMTLELTSFVKK